MGGKFFPSRLQLPCQHPVQDFMRSFNLHRSATMATAVAEDMLQDQEPQELQFADFEDDEEEFAGFDEESDAGQSDKDSTEEELERLVFGDHAGFRAGLKKAKQVVTVKGQPGRGDEEQEEETGLEQAQDADVGLT